MKSFLFIVYLQTVIIMKVDPKLALPQTIINFFMKQLAGIFLYMMQKQALVVSGFHAISKHLLVGGRAEISFSVS